MRRRRADLVPLLVDHVGDARAEHPFARGPRAAVVVDQRGAHEAELLHLGRQLGDPRQSVHEVVAVAARTRARGGVAPHAAGAQHTLRLGARPALRRDLGLIRPRRRRRQPAERARRPRAAARAPRPPVRPRRLVAAVGVRPIRARRQPDRRCRVSALRPAAAARLPRGPALLLQRRLVPLKLVAPLLPRLPPRAVLHLAGDHRDHPLVALVQRAAQGTSALEQAQRGHPYRRMGVTHRDERLALHRRQVGLDGLEHAGVRRVERVELVGVAVGW